MRSTIVAGTAAGVSAGIVFGFMMQMMSAPAPDGTSMPRDEAGKQRKEVSS